MTYGQIFPQHQDWYNIHHLKCKVEIVPVNTDALSLNPLLNVTAYLFNRQTILATSRLRTIHGSQLTTLVEMKHTSCWGDWLPEEVAIWS